MTNEIQNPSMARMSEALQQGLETARKKGAAGAKLAYGRTDRVGCTFDSGRLKDTEVRRGLYYSAEVMVEGKRGSATGNDPADMEEIIGRAVSLARAGSPAHFEKYPAPADFTPVRRYSERTAEMEREDLIEGGQVIVDELKRYNPDLYIQAEGSRLISEGLLVTSGGGSHPVRDTVWSLGAYAQRTEGTDMLFAYFGRGWKDWNELYDPEYMAGRIIKDLKWGETIATPPEGKVTALIPPEVLSMFLMPLVLGVNGRNVAKGDSPLRGRLGERIFAPAITVRDDPHLDFCTGAAEIDSDGIPARVMEIVKEGVLQSFLYDLDSAGLAGAEPTGNRGCMPYSLEVLPGQRRSEELLAGIKDGIFIRSLIGYGQSNMINGDFSSNVALGFRVKDGQIIGRVKNTMIAGNIYELFRQNIELSADRDPVARVPSALIEGLSVSTAKQ